jgi:peptidoglycan/xylan/chitin deacetylase (PgdA/CDA1 family)
MTKIAYLTIDDAPSPDFMNKLDFLDSHSIPAVWFCMGNFMEQRPDFVIEALQRGHIIGNHTYSHPHCSTLSLDQIYAEIRATDAILKELYASAGVEWNQRYFRFPYGDKGDGLNGDVWSARDPDGQSRHEAIQAYLRRLGYTQPTFPKITYGWYQDCGLLQDVDWYWTYDTFDWSAYHPNPIYGIDNVEKVLARTEEDLPEEGRGLHFPGSAEIILMHDHRTLPEVFGPVVERFLDMQLKFELPG